MEDYGWLLLKLVQLFGTDRVVLGDSKRHKAVAIGVWNGQQGVAQRKHSMWVERDLDGGHYSLNHLTDLQRETVVRKFIQACKQILWTT